VGVGFGLFGVGGGGWGGARHWGIDGLAGAKR
jgi:hypothetical protein